MSHLFCCDPFPHWLFKYCCCSPQVVSIKICKDTSQNATVSIIFIWTHFTGEEKPLNIQDWRKRQIFLVTPWGLPTFMLKTTLIGPHMYRWLRWKPHTNVSVSAGRLSYDVNPERRELTVSVSDMLEDHNYHLRLCRNDFICIGTGAHILVSPSQYDCVENQLID